MRTLPGWETYDDHYAGYEVRHYEFRRVTGPGAQAWWLDLDTAGLAEAFFEEVDTRRVRALVCGRAHDAEADYAVIAANAHRLPELRAMFLGAASPSSTRSPGSSSATFTRCWPPFPGSNGWRSAAASASSVSALSGTTG